MKRKPHLEEEQLLLWQKGEPEGFAYFFKAYKAALIVFATSLVKQNAVAEDIVQECLLKLWQKKPRIENVSALSRYFYRTVHNACIDHLKKETQANKSIKGLPQPREEESFFTGMVRSEMLRHLYHSMQHLPPQCAKIVQMYYDEGKDYKAIADELNLSINTVRNQRMKGIEMLKKKFPNMVWGAIVSGVSFIQSFL